MSFGDEEDDGAERISLETLLTRANETLIRHERDRSEKRKPHSFDESDLSDYELRRLWLHITQCETRIESLEKEIADLKRQR
jgi:hypothetical protein